MKRFIKVAAVCSLIAGILWASGIAPQAYNRIQQAAVNLTQRAILNFTGSGVNCVDNAGATRTDCTINAVGVANFSQAFTSQTSVTLTHNFASTAVLTQCYDNASPPNLIIPLNIAITSNNVVTVTFSVSQSGTCVVDGSPGGVATSVPASGITGTIANSQIGNEPWVCVSAASGGTTFTCTATYLDGSAVSGSALASPANAQEVVLIPDVNNLATDTLTVNAGGNTFGMWRNNLSVSVREFAGGEMASLTRQTFRFTTSSSKWLWQSGQNAQGIAPVAIDYSAGLLRVSFPFNGQTLFGGIQPTIGAGDCGTTPEGTVALGGTNNAGTINVGGGAVTTCKLTFSAAFANPPSCRVSTNSTSIAGDISSVGTASVTFGFSLSLGGGKIYYDCF